MKDNPQAIAHEYEIVKCNICDSDDYHVLYEADHGHVKNKDLLGVYRASADQFLFDQLVKCNTCGLIYVNPRLNCNTILRIYQTSEDQDFVSQAKAREKTFLKYVRQIEKHSPKGRILDVGTGSGAFLAAAKKRGWGVYGIELNTWLCAWITRNYNIEVKNGTLFEQRYPDSFFDVVTLWDVLEHMGDPKAVLSEIRRILKPNGLLVINFPNISSLLARLAGRKWWFLLSVHLYYFTPQTLRKLVRAVGFSSFKTGMHFQYLSLGYLVYRVKTYNMGAYKIANKIINTLGLGEMPIPYYAAQTNMFCRNEKR